MVYFKHTQLRPGIPIGESIQACPEQNILPHARSDGSRQIVLRVPAARDDMRPQGDGERPVGSHGRAPQLLHIGVT